MVLELRDLGEAGPRNISQNQSKPR